MSQGDIGQLVQQAQPNTGRFGLQGQPFNINDLFGPGVLGPPQGGIGGLGNLGIGGTPNSRRGGGGFGGGLLDVGPESLPFGRGRRLA